MRIDSVTVTNYKGIRYAEVRDLSNSGVVTVSGPNGAGKSLLLEAMAGSWANHLPNPEKLVGPWGDESTVEIHVSFLQEELRVIAEFLGEEQEVAPIRVTMARRTGELQRVQHPWMRLIDNAAFQEAHGFLRLDLLPADRTIPRESVGINPQLLGEEQTRRFRAQVLHSVFENRTAVQLSGVLPYLASLDYLELIAEREGREATHDFATIADAFADATGKKLGRPRTDPGQGAAIPVLTQAGIEHSIHELSSGEQEVLGLMYFIRRLSSQGGILFLDEPELHLHPALQASLFDVIERTAERAQVWMTTHSPRLISAAPAASLLRMRPPTADDRQNQVSPAHDALERAALITDLGMNPVDLLQSDAVLIVEGATDAQRLASLFPIEMGRVAVHVAGSASGVEAVARALGAGDFPLPWLAVRDGDFLTDQEANEIAQDCPNLIVWGEREIENLILHPELVAAAMTDAGRAEDAASVAEKMKQLADAHREAIVAELVDKQLSQEHEHEPARADDLVERKRLLIENVVGTAERKLADFDRIVAEVRRTLGDHWDEQWHRLMDGKRMLGEYVRHTPFRSRPDFLAALEQTGSKRPEVFPDALRDFRDLLAAAIARD